MTKPLILAVIEYHGVTATLNSDGKWESNIGHVERYLNRRFSPAKYSTPLMSNTRAAVMDAVKVTGATLKKLDEGKDDSDVKEVVH